jgi:endonuclease/exonuclease/phosphatase family metal-dependent hydrolase
MGKARQSCRAFFMCWRFLRITAFKRVRRAGSLLFCLFVLVLFPFGSATGQQEIRFAHYNVENYLEMNRRDGGESSFGPKPENEKAALFRIIKEIHPDILGVAEMGPPAQFEDFQKRLRQIELDYPYSEYVQGADPERHIALVSRFKIVDHNSQSDVSFDLNGHREHVARGFLDVTVEVSPGYRLRFVGAHLKSRLPVPAGEALLRRNEAKLFRQHLVEVMDKDPAANLIVYGDFNETKDQPAFQEIAGPRQAKTHLSDIWLSDGQGDHWTYYRRFSDVYDRIDYVLVNQTLLAQVDRKRSFVYRSDDWREASDHRPIVVTIRMPTSPTLPTPPGTTR